MFVTHIMYAYICQHNWPGMQWISLNNINVDFEKISNNILNVHRIVYYVFYLECLHFCATVTHL